MAGRFWAGIDVGVETAAICVINDAGEVLQEATCPTDLSAIDQQLRWLKRKRFATVAFEASGTALARGLRNRGYAVDLYETRKLSKFLRVRRNKTDAGDALGIAEAGRIGASLVSKVYLKSFECQCLQSRLTIRRHLIRQRVAAVNLLCRQLEHYGGRVKRSTRSLQLRSAVEAEILKIFSKQGSPLADELRNLLHYCEQLLEYQRRVDNELKRLAGEIDVCQRFMEIPGVGPLAALTFYAAVGDPYRFSRSSDIGSYLGLAPRLHQSGVRSRLGRISRMGNKATRMLLVQAAKGFVRSQESSGTALLEWTDSIEQRRGRGQSRIALARKLAVIMLTMWKSGTTFVKTPSPTQS